VVAPDTTTENGHRLLTAHIDGDGFVSLAEMRGRPYSGAVIRDQILKVFALPTTVSVIEGEVGPSGIYAEQSPRLEELARDIFALPNVEIASHTYSHPFDWVKAASEKGGKDIYHLPIPGYRYDPRREVEGSVRYINRRLAPPGKKVRVMLWSGEALPGAEALAIAHEIGVENVNGGNTQITRERNSLTEVAPLGLQLGGNYQVYAAIQNENVFTNLWHGPYNGFRTAIESFELTDQPRRLKPICIYYHFYSGSKIASLRALEDVYLWALKQEQIPVWLSDYARKAREFQTASMARRPDGGIEIRGMTTLRTLRIDRALGYPDMERSRGVAGFRDLPQGRYVHLTGGEVSLLQFSQAPPVAPYLRRANAEIVRWERQGATIDFQLRGHMPVLVVVGDPSGRCRLDEESGTSTTSRATSTRYGDELTLSFTDADTGERTLDCTSEGETGVP
jgi:hypothetical protein